MYLLVDIWSYVADMHNLNLLLQNNFNNPRKLLQLHSLLVTTAFSIPTTLFFNCLIKCHPNKSTLIFTQILARSLLPNSHTFPSLLNATPSLTSLQSIHVQIIRRGLALDNFTNCSLINAYARFGRLFDARKVFEEMPHPDNASCNAMLHAMCLNGDFISAFGLFIRLPDRDIVSWTTVINGLAKNGRFREAVGLFRELVVEGGEPNEATLVSALSACANLDSWLSGKEIHGYVVRREERMSSFLGTALIDFYGKRGSLRSCTVLFRLSGKEDVCVWNAMISALACNGKEVEAIDLFDEMLTDSRLRPNHITAVAALTACSRGKLVELGLSLFDKMSSEYGIVPSMEHYGCVVDILSRAGRLREAWEFIRTMPMEPDSSVLGAVLGACRIHGDAALGAQVGKKLMALQPQHSGRYAVLSNILAEAGRWDEAKGLRVKMEKAGVDKFVGYSRLDSASSIR